MSPKPPIHGKDFTVARAMTERFPLDPDLLMELADVELGLGHAEILVVDHRFDHVIDAFKELAREYPGDSKIWISLARALGWSKRYDESLKVYDEICRANPQDPVPRMEKVRTAAWGKRTEEAAGRPHPWDGYRKQPRHQGRGEGHYEFLDRWLLNLKGMVHRSREWNVNALWASLQYRF